MATGTTYDSKLTRDQLLEQAYKLIGALPDDEPMTATMSTDGVISLNMLLRELSDDEIYVHAESTSTLTLVANTFVYTSANGLPTTMRELNAAVYRDGSARDMPLDVLTRQRYEAISNKTDSGDPKWVFLTDELTISSRTLYVAPMLSSVNTQSEVIGSDALNYRCIRGHAADSTNKPITGANYLLYWELGGSSGSAWVTGTAYTAPELLRLTSRRPLYDFDLESDNPDIPDSQTRWLKWKLAAELGPSWGLTLQEADGFDQKAGQIYASIFRNSMIKKSKEKTRRRQYY